MSLAITPALIEAVVASGVLEVGPHPGQVCLVLDQDRAITEVRIADATFSLDCVRRFVRQLQGGREWRGSVRWEADQLVFSEEPPHGRG